MDARAESKAFVERIMNEPVSPSIPTETREPRNPYRYESGWTIEQHRDELIDRLGKAIKRINELEEMVRHV